MLNQEIQSEAFRETSLRSERLRIVALLSVLALLLVFTTARALLSSDTASQLSALPGLLALLGGLLLYEGWMLAFISRRMAKQLQPNRGVWLINVIIETSLPSAALILMTETEFMGPYRALSSPVLLTYFFFILLSVLRLDPTLSGTTGLVASAGYAVAVVYTRVRYPESPVGAFPLQIYVTFGVFLFLGGLTAAGVAYRVRTHVLAALREAETKHRLEKIEGDLSIARSIQQGLLPQAPPEIDGFDVAGWNQPADETGGDYFDWQELPDGRVAISLADVTGHGIGPALVTAVCRAYSRASFPSGDELGTLMCRMNGLLFEDLSAGRFITFVVCLLDAKGGRMELLSAGQGPILLYRAADDSVRASNAHDIPLGLTPDVSYGPPEKIELSPGDMIVLTTDGFFEWNDPSGEQFGIERLIETVRRSKDLTAQEVIDAIYSEVKIFVGASPQTDDLTAVVIKRIVT